MCLSKPRLSYNGKKFPVMVTFPFHRRNQLYAKHLGLIPFLIFPSIPSPHIGTEPQEVVVKIYVHLMGLSFNESLFGSPSADILSSVYICNISG